MMVYSYLSVPRDRGYDLFRLISGLQWRSDLSRRVSAFAGTAVKIR